MTQIPDSFKAFRIHNDAEGYRAGIESIGIDDLSKGDVIIRGEWSGINYKDALAATGKGKILHRFPLVGGIDVAGEVIRQDPLPGEVVRSGDTLALVVSQGAQKRKVPEVRRLPAAGAATDGAAGVFLAMTGFL